MSSPTADISTPIALMGVAPVDLGMPSANKLLLDVQAPHINSPTVRPYLSLVMRFSVMTVTTNRRK